MNGLTIPMGRIVKFAIATAMRQEEISRVTWDDLDHQHKMLLIRDRKDPRLKRGNHQNIPLLDVSGYDAWHFHDLRHEATSRLFEAEYKIPEVSLVTGHKDWKMLKRYTHINPQDLHAIGARRRAAREAALEAQKRE